MADYRRFDSLLMHKDNEYYLNQINMNKPTIFGASSFNKTINLLVAVPTLSLVEKKLKFGGFLFFIRKTADYADTVMLPPHLKVNGDEYIIEPSAGLFIKNDTIVCSMNRNDKRDYLMRLVYNRFSKTSTIDRSFIEHSIKESFLYSNGIYYDKRKNLLKTVWRNVKTSQINLYDFPIQEKGKDVYKQNYFIKDSKEFCIGYAYNGSLIFLHKNDIFIE